MSRPPKRTGFKLRLTCRDAKRCNYYYILHNDTIKSPFSEIHNIIILDTLNAVKRTSIRIFSHVYNGSLGIIIDDIKIDKFVKYIEISLYDDELMIYTKLDTAGHEPVTIFIKYQNYSETLYQNMLRDLIEKL